MKKTITAFLSIFIFASTFLSANTSDQMFFELSPDNLKSISESTQQVFEHGSESPVWFGLVFDTQLTAKRIETTTLELPGVGGFFLERESLKQNDHGILVWSGKAYDSEGQAGTAQFMLTSEGIEGFVAMNGDYFVITPIGNSIHRITLEQALPTSHPPQDAELTQAKASRYGLGTPVLSLNSDYCLGYVWGDWTSVSGATYYVLATTSGIILQSGSSTFTGVNFGCCSNVVIRVKACNGSGCGAWSNSFYGVYYPVCY